MASVNSASLRDEFDGYKADIDSLRKEARFQKKPMWFLAGCAACWES